MCFFSIIIPTYNRANVLAETIYSVQKQFYQNWECLVIDDGSTDNTKEVVESMSKLDRRIKYIYQQNSERSAARNKGINHAVGEYLCFLDSDDFYLENHLLELKKKIDLAPVKKSMFFSNYQYAVNGIITIPEIPSLHLNVQEYLVYNPIIPARVAIHNSILKKIQFDEDIVIVEDFLLWLKISYKYHLIHLELPTVIYNIHEDNSVNIKNNAAQKRLSGLKVFFKKYPDIKEALPNKYYNFLYGDTHFAIAKYYLHINDLKKAFKHILISIAFQKFHNQLKHKLYVLYKLLLNKSIVEYHNK